MENINTPVFRNKTFLSKIIGPTIRQIAFLTSPFKDEQQIYYSCRNLEISVEGLIKLLIKHPVKLFYLLKVIKHWDKCYFKAQKKAINKDRYLVYTNKDHKIPFVPEEDIMYSYMYPQIFFVLGEISNYLTNKEMQRCADCFITLNDLSHSVFTNYPTLMPRFTNHKRVSLSVVQKFDEPLNCCPSLHIAYSVMLDNIAQMILGGNKEYDSVLKSIKYSTLRMMNSVLYVKQHSLMDIAFGILCSKIMFEQYYDYEFNNFISEMKLQQRDHPEIDYNEIEIIFNDALDIFQRTKCFESTLAEYLKINGYQKVSYLYEAPSHSYFDTLESKIIS